MTWQMWFWLLGILPWAIAGCIHSEWERQSEIVSLRNSGFYGSAAELEEATLRCGLDGIVVGLMWPFVAALSIVLAVVWLFSLPGKVLR